MRLYVLSDAVESHTERTTISLRLCVLPAEVGFARVNPPDPLVKGELPQLRLCEKKSKK
jgi:hypothetical protein